MKVGDAFPSKYLKTSDLGGRSVKVTIAEVMLEEVGEERDEKPILYFKGKKKGVVLNVTNATVLEEAFGDEMDDWTGKEIEIYNDPSIMFGKKKTGGIRVRVGAKPEPPPPAEDDGEIPF